MPVQPTTSSSTGRTRTAVACIKCRERKIKCSGETPCQRCASRSLDCQYQTERAGGSRRNQAEKKNSSRSASHSLSSEHQAENAYPSQLSSQPNMIPLPAHLQMHLAPPEFNSLGHPQYYNPYPGPQVPQWPPMMSLQDGMMLVPGNYPNPSHSSNERYLPIPRPPDLSDDPTASYGLPTSQLRTENHADKSTEGDEGRRRSSLEGSILLQPLTHTPTV